MRQTTITGPITGYPYRAFDTGDTWNGAPVLAFSLGDLTTLIRAGDGADVDGGGLWLDTLGRPWDGLNGSDEPIATVLAEVDGDTLLLCQPVARFWEFADPMGTVRGIGYDAADECRDCGAHLSDPHDPGCRTALAATLREVADRMEDQGLSSADVAVELRQVLGDVETTGSRA